MNRFHVLGLVLATSFTLMHCKGNSGTGSGPNSAGVGTNSAGVGGSSAGAGGSSSSNGTGAGGNGLACEVYCAKWNAANCPNEDKPCPDLCSASAGKPECKPTWDAAFACIADHGTFSCDGAGKVKGPLGCDDETLAALKCAVNGTGGSGGGTGSGSGAGGGSSGAGGSSNVGACYDGLGDCNPLDPTSCGPGEQCDIKQGGGFGCFPPPNNAGLGDPCDNVSGPYCQMGLFCSGTCLQFCCDDADCGGGTCTALGPAEGIDVNVCQ